MSEYTPFQQSFVGDLEIEDYKRHLTMPDDPCSTCYYYPDYYSDCPACSATGKPTIELTDFAFGSLAFTGPNKHIPVFHGAHAPNYPFTEPVERNGTKYPYPSTLAECVVRLDDCAQYTGNLPWPVSMSTALGANCAGQSGYFDAPTARAAWGDYIGVSCVYPASACWGCQALPTTYIDPPETTYDVSIFACYNLHYATSYRPGCKGQVGSSSASSYCTGDDQWKPIFTLPPGLLVYVSAISRGNSCFNPIWSNRVTSPTHRCFRVYHMELTRTNQFGQDIKETRPLPYYYQNRTAYQLNCNRSGELNLIYESTNDYYYVNVRRIASHIGPEHSSFNPSCIGEHVWTHSYGTWNGGDGKVKVNPNTAVVIPARPKAGASASASGTASVG